MRRNPAPAELGLVEEFCNTATHLHGEDDLARPESAARWLGAHGFPALSDPGDLTSLAEAREIVRAFLVERTSSEAVEALNRLVATVAGAPAVRPDGALALRPASGEAVAEVMRPVLEALLFHGLTGRHATRLKACAAPECRWVFYDRAPSSNGLWCDMDVCGARHKMRAYRARGGAAARRDA
ncbi:CGNR zinc finger domain-containing protein [Streptomyces sp. ID03-2B]|uniref:CGNR zinc finger domain-containing protein n=1 Tax=Streptomyces sp. ID03-2B TaxID=3028660 RepID=UPI0029AC676B|nr:CGNR zinc finger domain-containing protein [Streptomyces sp. ID03-2B]MDX3594441.1 CGNR zinc finger domain-containing protein [Streptomyces sp. ID03-2B]